LQQCVVGVLRGAGPMFAQVGDIGIYFEEVGAATRSKLSPRGWRLNCKNFG
jgi:hypothetical protein